MTFSIGTFDLFTYAVPGSLYLSLFGYLSFRLDLIDPDQIAGYPVLFLLVVIAVGSYLLGHATYGVGIVIDKILPLWRLERFDARAVFAGRVADLVPRPGLAAHYSILQTAAELHDKEVAKDIVRLRAIGLMLRNATIPLLVATTVCIGELLIGFGGLIPLACGGWLLLMMAGATWRSHVLRLWANLRTLEICFLMPDLDAVVAQHWRADQPTIPAPAAAADGDVTAGQA